MLFSRVLKRAALLALAIAGVASTAVAAPRAFTAKDMAMLDRAADPRLSPDGRFLVWDVRSTDWAGNKSTHALWLLDSRTPAMAPRRLGVSEKGATSPRWSPDGRRLYFLSSRAGSQQLWRTDSDGAEAVQVTNLPVDVASYRIAPDGKAIVVALEVFPDCADLACTRARLDARKAGGVSGATHDRLPFVIWDTWRARTLAHLFTLRLDDAGAASAAPIPLMKDFDADGPTRPFGDDADFAIVGGRVIFTALPPGMAWGSDFQGRLYAAPLDGSAAPAPLGPTAPGSYGAPTPRPARSATTPTSRSSAVG